jgi:hypothetical protein
MNVILGYASLHNFEKYYKEYGEIIFEILLHNANENSSIAINLLDKNNTLFDAEHKIKLFQALTHISPFNRFNNIELNDLQNEVRNAAIEYIRQFGNMIILSRYIDLEEHDIKLICSYLLWLAPSLIKANEQNFKKIVDYLISNFKENILDSSQIQLFADNTSERREYIAESLFKIVDVRVLFILNNANCVDNIAYKYREKYIDYFISEMDKYNDVVLYKFIRSFRKDKLPDIVEKKLLTNNLYMCMDATRCKTICRKNNISKELKSELQKYMKSEYVLKALTV